MQQVGSGPPVASHHNLNLPKEGGDIQWESENAVPKNELNSNVLRAPKNARIMHSKKSVVIIDSSPRNLQK